MGAMFRRFFEKKQRAEEAERSLLSEALQGSILHSLGLKDVPSMPATAQEAFRVAVDPNSDARDFIDVIEADEGFSARLLKIANSVFYDRGGGSKTIVDAVNVVGISELRNLLNASVLSGLFPVKHYLRAEFWTHNIATALTAKVLAQSLMTERSESVFLAGMMHDVGKLLILQQHVGNYEEIVKKGLASGVESTVSEVAEYPYDHTHVGHMLAERWRFSPQLIDVIANHHKPWTALEKGSLVSVVKLADMIVHVGSFGCEHDSVAYKRIYAPLLEEAWMHFGVPLREQKQVLQQAELDFYSEFQNFEAWGRS